MCMYAYIQGVWQYAVHYGVVVLTLLLVPLQLQAAVVDEREGLQSSDLLIDAQVLQQRRTQCMLHSIDMQCYSIMT